MRISIMAALAIAVTAFQTPFAPALAQQSYSSAAIGFADRLSFQSAARIDAVKESYDERLAAQSDRIEAMLAERKRLRTRISSERSQRVKAEAQLVALDARIDAMTADFNARLAAQSEAFARERARLMTLADDLLTTREGREVLAGLLEGKAGAYEAGDDILVQAQKARAALRAEQARKADAADARARAVFAKAAWERGLAGLQTVISRYRDVVATDPSDHWDWVQLAILHLDARTLNDAHDAATRALETAADDRDRAIALGLLGDILAQRNDRTGALAFYEKSLDIRRKLLTLDPSSVEARRDLLLGLNDVADMLMARNLLAPALERYEEGLGIARGLAALQPASVLAERDVFVSLNRIGDVYVARNDPRSAMLRFDEALRIARKLAAREPASIEAKRDVALTLTRIGDILMESGDAAGAKARFTESLAIDRDLAAVDPDWSKIWRDTSVNVGRLGDLALEARDLDAALTYYEEDLALARRLAAIDETSAMGRLDVALSLSKVADIFAARSDAAGAIVRYEESLGIIRKVADVAPDSAREQRYLLVALSKLAEINAPGHGWRAVKAQADHMRARKLNQASDDAAFLEIDRRAAEEARRSGRR